MEKIEKTTFSTKGGDPGSDNFWQIINWSVSNIVLCLTKVKRDKKRTIYLFFKFIIERKKILLEMPLKREKGFFQLFFRSLFPLLNEPANSLTIMALRFSDENFIFLLLQVRRKGISMDKINLWCILFGV